MSKPVMDDPIQEEYRLLTNAEFGYLDRDEMMRQWRALIWKPAPVLQVTADKYETHPWLFPMQKAIVGARLGKVARNQG